MRLWLPLSIIAAWAFLAIFSFVFSLTPDAIDLTNILSPPSLEHWLGHDELGRPVADRLISGAHTSFFVSLCVVALGVSLGSLLGVSSAYLSGWVDAGFVRIVDVMLAFPGLLLAIALAGVAACAPAAARKLSAAMSARREPVSRQRSVPSPQRLGRASGASACKGMELPCDAPEVCVGKSAARASPPFATGT